MKELLEKIHKVQSKVSVIDKTGHNDFSNYDYVQLGSILETLNPLLDELGLVIVQSVVDSSFDYKEHERGYYSLGYCVVETFVYDADSGHFLSNKSSGFAMDKNGDKAMFKAITGARKYGLSSFFKAHWDSIEPETDTPSTSTSPKTRSKKAQSNSDFF